MSRTLSLCVSLALVAGCKGKKTDEPPATTIPPPVAIDTGSAPAPKGDAPTPAAPAMSPAERAKQLLDVQVDAIKNQADAKLVATLDPSAIVMAGAGYEAKQEGVAKLVGSIHPHDTIKDVKAVISAAGGNADAVWVAAEITITKLVQEPETKDETRTETMRVSELLTAASGWKVVAAGFAWAGELESQKDPVPMPPGNTPGALANLLTAPDQIGAVLAADPAVVVIGLGAKDIGIGADAAKKILDTFKDKKITIDTAHEVHDAKWGYAQAALEAPSGKRRPYRFSGQIFALPKADGSWQVVAVQYMRL